MTVTVLVTTEDGVCQQMVLQTLSTVISRAIPSRYYTPSIATLVVLIITYAYSQGRRTTRDRDLHARVIILTVSLHYAGPISTWMGFLTGT